MDTFDANSAVSRTKLILKCADLGHAYAPIHAHVSWVDKLQSEFFIQGDKEKVHGLPVTAMFDRDAPHNMADTQPRFFRTIILPMFDLLFATYPGMDADHIKHHLRENLQYWESRI